ncbi:Osmotically-inducible protein OsmY, contains BON domain [Methylobacterium sp. UNC378MF]|jgi:osmotically-inducible protein OsmY|nr:Osmotically-inducible protein OsmY, contains BON domain [Methylobacterium sp. UNC378MF]
MRKDAMTDKDLRRAVLDELDFDPSLDAGDIGVAVADGVVTLTGHVGSYAEKVEAERAVRRVRGVRAIAQDIEVRYADDKKVADDQIAARALAIIDWSVHLPKQAIQVKVAGGWVTLTGTVDWQYQMAGVEAAVRKLSGVHGVTNLIEVRPQVPPKAVKDKILEAFKRGALFEADQIKVTVSGDKVTLEGAVTAWAERDAAERAAWSVPGVRAVEDRIVALS